MSNRIYCLLNLFIKSGGTLTEDELDGYDNRTALALLGKSRQYVVHNKKAKIFKITEEGRVAHYKWNHTDVSRVKHGFCDSLKRIMGYADVTEIRRTRIKKRKKLPVRYDGRRARAIAS
jgi:hypothetical protein